VDGIVEFPLLDHGKASANVYGKRAVDGYTDHAVGWVPEALEKGLGFTHTLKTGRIAGLYVNAYHLADVVVHRVPKNAVAGLHASLLDIIEKAGWSRLPVVSFFGHDACGVVLSESFIGNRGITQVLRDLEKPLVSFRVM